MLKDCEFLDYIKTVICSIVCVCFIALAITYNNAMSDVGYREQRIESADIMVQSKSDLIDKKNDQLDMQIYYR